MTAACTFRSAPQVVYNLRRGMTPVVTAPLFREKDSDMAPAPGERNNQPPAVKPAPVTDPNPSSSAPPAARSRAVTRIGIALLGCLALLAIAPQLVALSPLRHETPRLRLRGFEGIIRVGSASLSWWSPIVLRDMELYAPDGERFIHIRQYTEERSVFQLLFRPHDPSHIRIEAPVIMLNLRADGSNIEDALRPVLDHPQRESSRERSLEVAGGSLRATDLTTSRAAEWTEIALTFHSLPDGSKPNAVKLSTRLAGADAADPLELSLVWPSADNSAREKDTGAPDEKSSRELTVKTSALPLAAFAPLLARLQPDLELAGSLTTTLRVELPDSSPKSSGSPVQIDGRISVQGLEVASSRRLGDDRFAVESIELEGKMSADGARAHVERLDIKTDVGQLSAAGTFPYLSPTSPDENPSLTDRMEQADFTLRGELDLVRLARLLPDTLRIREGMELTEGRIEVDLASTVDHGQPRWKGRLATTRLAATMGSERFTWEQPIQLAFEFHRESDRLAIDRLVCKSDAIEFSGHGDTEEGKLTARSNLAQLAARLGQFVELEDRELQGRLSLDTKWKRSAEGPIDLSLEIEVAEFAAAVREGATWSEPSLVSRVETRLVDERLQIKQIQSLQFALARDKARPELEAQLVDPVDLAGSNPRWTWEVQLGGDLAQWGTRLSTLGLLDSAKLAGEFRSRSRFSITAEEISIDSLSAELQSLAISQAGLDLREPHVTMNLSGHWVRPERRLSLASLEAVGSAGSALGRDIVISVPSAAFPQIEGHLKIQTDLDRLNPADAPPDERQWGGKVVAEVNFAREGEGTAGHWRLDIEDLNIRRQVTRLVERRRGDVEPIENPPAAVSPPPPSTAPLDRRARRTMERAERNARRDASRRERELRKRAEEIVVVREVGWKTLWEDPHMTLSGRAQFDQNHDTLTLADLTASTEGMRVTAKATIAEASNRAVIDLQGEVDCDVDRFLARLKQTIGEHVHIAGRERRTFAISGPLRGATMRTAESSSAGIPAPPPPGARVERTTQGVIQPVAHEAASIERPLVSRELKGDAQGGWTAADLFGLKAGPATIDIELSDAVVAIRPCELTLSGGTLRLGPQLLLGRSPATLVLPEGPVIQNVELSQDVCDTWLKFVAPILSEATRVEGRFSLDLADSRLPLNDPASGALEGRLHIATAQVLAGPLFNEIGALIGEIEAAVRLGKPGDLLGLDKPLVRIENQAVSFKLQDRRLYSTPLEFDVRGIPVRTSGSVGADESLDMAAEITLPAEWVRRVPVLSRLGGKAMVIPIKGTLRHPKVDASGIGRFWEQFGQDALDGLINGGLQKLLDR